MKIPMQIAKGAVSTTLTVLVLGLVPAGLCLGLGETVAAAIFGGLGLSAAVLVLFFFRDPERESDADPAAVLSGADGMIHAVEEFEETRYLRGEIVRISTFLNLFNVHVNRSPLSGVVEIVDYCPGKKLFAFLRAASEYNEHNAIVIRGDRVHCMVRQIVGPVARRVFCWKSPGTEVKRGERIGIMKFGSRLDVYLPRDCVEVLVREGDKVRAGETVIARCKIGSL